MNEIASRYALALYSIATEEDKILTWQEEIRTLNTLFKENHEFLMVLSSAFLSLEDKEGMLDRTLKGFTTDIVNLIKVMIKNHREKYILETFHAFNSLCNGSRGVKEGLLYSTIKLDEETIKRISKKIGEKEHTEVELYNVIDPTLIGGVKVVIDGHIYDGSVKNHLENLKLMLIR